MYFKVLSLVQIKKFNIVVAYLQKLCTLFDLSIFMNILGRPNYSDTDKEWHRLDAARTGILKNNAKPAGVPKKQN